MAPQERYTQALAGAGPPGILEAPRSIGKRSSDRRPGESSLENLRSRPRASRQPGEETMPRFLIEVPHDPDVVGCARVVKVFLSSGSHLLTHADWGCRDGDHHAWMIVDVSSKDEARAIVPPAFRASARVVALNHFSMDEIDTILKEHQSA
jgi:hypothetical protein